MQWGNRPAFGPRRLVFKRYVDLVAEAGCLSGSPKLGVTIRGIIRTSGTAGISMTGRKLDGGRGKRNIERS